MAAMRYKRNAFSISFKYFQSKIYIKLLMRKLKYTLKLHIQNDSFTVLKINCFEIYLQLYTRFVGKYLSENWFHFYASIVINMEC